MTTPLLLRAAEIIEEEAEALRICHTVKDVWMPEEDQVKRDYDEMLDIARQLRERQEQEDIAIAERNILKGLLRNHD